MDPDIKNEAGAKWRLEIKMEKKRKEKSLNISHTMLMFAIYLVLFLRKSFKMV